MSFVTKIKSLFGSKKSCCDNGCCCESKKQSDSQDNACCCSDSACGDVPVNPTKLDSIKVLGAGCAKCHQLHDAVVSCTKDLGLIIDVEYITDMSIIAGYGVMSMPALVINEKVVSYGKVLKPNDIKSILEQYQ